jgi:hypothetical protein
VLDHFLKPYAGARRLNRQLLTRQVGEKSWLFRNLHLDVIERYQYVNVMDI